jgi:endonuclease-3
MDYNELFSRLKKTLPEAGHTRKKDPFKVLISTIISQRTRDEQTAAASKRLFSAFPTAEELADADIKEIEKLIAPAGFYRVKAKKIKEVSNIILTENKGKVPDDFDSLIKLPSVGRKTANCVLVFGFGRPAIPVDTHVHRISNRLGLVKTSKPEETEMALVEILPKKYWLDINHLFVSFGKKVCRPQNPRCDSCPLTDMCKWFKMNKKQP